MQLLRNLSPIHVGHEGSQLKPSIAKQLRGYVNLEVDWDWHRRDGEAGGETVLHQECGDHGTKNLPWLSFHS